jgi:hypothetical protein
MHSCSIITLDHFFSFFSFSFLLFFSSPALSLVYTTNDYTTAMPTFQAGQNRARR